MKLYRDIEPGETLQAGDEKQQWPLEWAPVDPAFYGANPGAYRLEYRRPVNLPMLQPVTPEAIKELEQRGAWVILFRHKQAQWTRYAKAAYSKFGRCWFSEGDNEIDPLDFCWFIDLLTILETT